MNKSSGRRVVRVQKVSSNAGLPPNIDELVARSASRLNQATNVRVPTNTPGLSPEALAQFEDTRKSLGTVRIDSADPDQAMANLENVLVGPEKIAIPQNRNDPYNTASSKPVAPPAPASIEHRVTEPLIRDEDSFNERTILPSGCIFYPFSDVQIRQFGVPDLSKLYRAVQNSDHMLFNDVIGATLNIDVRDLWIQDYQYILQWHKINSFIRLPYNTTWTSIYGNKNRSKVKMTDLIVEPLKMTKERYAYWESRGFKYPSLRDQEHYQSFSDNLNDDQKFLYERAAYLVGDSFDERVSRLSNEGIDILFDLKEFRQELLEGKVYLQASLQDQHFEYDKSLNFLREAVKEINEILLNDTSIPESWEDSLIDRKSKIDQEIKRLESVNPGEAEPMLETIPLNISAFDFFPDI